MEKFPVAWGLDIGHSSIKAVKLSRSGTTVTVLGYAIEPITVAENADRDEAIVRAMQSLALREEIGSTPVLAALSGRQVFTRTVNIPMLNPKKVDRMVELEARQQVPGDFNEVEWSYHLSPGADGASNDVALFAVKKELIQELLAKSRKAGINLVGVSVSSLALYNFVQYDQVFPADETVIILDVGAENTDLVFYQGDALHMATLAVSGNDITRAFMKKFRVSFDEAETLKRQVNDSRQADKIIKVIEGSLGELTSDVQRRIGFYKQQRPEAKLENLVISGNTFRLPGLPEYIAERLRYTVNILEDLDRIQVANGLEREHFLHDLQALGVAMGLALQATGAAKATINLMPTDERIQKILREKRWAAVAVIALIAVTFAINYAVTARILDENEHLTRTVKGYYAKNQAESQKARDTLQTVGPRAQELRSFDPFGTQKGVSHAVFEGVAGIVQDTQAAYGVVGDRAKGPESGGNPVLAAVYLQSIDVPAFRFTGPGGPFRPFAEPREVVVSVRIPSDFARAPEVQERFQESLKKLAVPDYLQVAHPDYRAYRARLDEWRKANATPEARVGNPPPDPPPLFSEVQIRSTNPFSGDNFYFIDDGHLNAEGNADPINRPVPVRMILATYVCTLKEAGQ